MLPTGQRTTMMTMKMKVCDQMDLLEITCIIQVRINLGFSFADDEENVAFENEMSSTVPSSAEEANNDVRSVPAATSSETSKSDEDYVNVKETAPSAGGHGPSWLTGLTKASSALPALVQSTTDDVCDSIESGPSVEEAAEHDRGHTTAGRGGGWFGQSGLTAMVPVLGAGRQEEAAWGQDSEAVEDEADPRSDGEQELSEYVEGYDGEAEDKPVTEEEEQADEEQEADGEGARSGGALARGLLGGLVGSVAQTAALLPLSRRVGAVGGSLWERSSATLKAVCGPPRGAQDRSAPYKWPGRPEQPPSFGASLGQNSIQ
jgi:hypothetical protein